MSPSPARPRLWRVLAAGLAILAILGATSPAGAAKPPRVLLTGGDHWFTHPVGSYQVVLGRADVQLGKQTSTGDLVANVVPDDHSLPAAGECESSLTSVWVTGDGDSPDVNITGVGEMCGHFVQEPVSVVVYSFTGEAYFEEVGSRRLNNKVGFLDIRLAQDGRAHVFATLE